MSETKKFEMIISFNNPIVRDHQVHGIRVLPGVVFMDIIYRLLSNSFENKVLVLKKIVFKEPVAVTEKFDRKLFVTLIKKDTHWNIIIDSQKIKENETLSSHKTTHAECELFVEDKIDTKDHIDLEEIHQQGSLVLEVDDIYNQAKTIDIVHKDFMKPQGKIYQYKNHLLMTLKLREIANQYTDQFFIHPAFLDSATLIFVAVQMTEIQSLIVLDKPYIPIFIEEFIAFSRGIKECNVYCEQKLEIQGAGDIINFNLKAYDERGNLAFLMKGVAAKRIRDKTLISQLAEMENITTSPMKLVKSNVEKEDVKPPAKENFSEEIHEISNTGIVEIKDIKKYIANEITQMLSGMLNVQSSQLDSKVGFYDLGLDSKQLLQVVKELEAEVKSTLYPTLLFEYNNIQDLSDFLYDKYKTHYDQKMGQNKTASMPDTEKLKSDDSPKKTVHDTHITPISENEKKSQDIAIIGLSGRYPQAKNLEEFWNNLKEGRDSVTEIPKERWDYHLYYDPDKNKLNKSYSKWGGFIEDVDKFDPLFFNISPSQAELMDPQERLFLETAWNTIEDAGYSLEELSSQSVGVFVGAMYGHYQLFGAEESLKGNVIAPNSFFSSIANRVSYYFNLNGPSIALDTMCSSSLVTIHLACRSIQEGECDMAIAGGVNVAIHPSKYTFLSQSRLLSSDGHCQSFGIGGDGYVPGEGVGAILLKPLEKALKDGDHIYGVIKGSSINHSGKSGGFSIPNPQAQANVIEKAFIKSKIEPKEVNYIEAMGTGSALGDPIEITGLTKVFGEGNEAICAIGSVKSNIGHLESAAGIASVTKVLLQLAHHALVPSLHSETLNPNVDWEHVPFKVQREFSDWPSVVIEENGTKKTLPRRAGISAFGAGGTNAHVIIEEAPTVEHVPSSKTSYLITLSAKTKESLKQKQIDLANWLTRKINEKSSVQLEEVSYTLNVGRSHFEYRCAFVVGSLQELQEKLEIVSRQQSVSGYYEREISKKKGDSAVLNKMLETTLSEIKSHSLHEIQYKKDLEVLADLYVQGYELDWKTLHEGELKRRLSLPTYPFIKNRYWIESVAPNKNKKETYYYNSVWKQQAADAKKDVKGPFLIIDEDEKFFNPLIDKLAKEIVYRASQKNNLQEELIKLSDKNSFPNKIFIKEKNIFSLFELAKALLKQKLKDPVNVICINEINERRDSIYTEAISGFLKTLHEENPKIKGRVIEFPSESPMDLLINEINQNEDQVRYKNGIRFIKNYAEIIPSERHLPLKTKGVYLITGGAGELGLIFAHYLAKKYQAKILITGRSELKEIQKTKITTLGKTGAEILYVQADITKEEDVVRVLQTVKKNFGQLNGIIHSAGVLRDALIIKKTPEQISQVLAPKIQGTLNLDDATKSEPLDFFVLFSSISSLFGNMGQCDYAYANGFMDGFATYRNSLKEEGRRQGKTVSINWPLWLKGGMQVDEISIQFMEDMMGVKPIETEEGIAAFEEALSQERSQFIVLAGDKTKIESKLPVIMNQDVTKIALAPLMEPLTYTTENKSAQLESEIEKPLEAIQEKIITILSDILKVDPKEIKPHRNMSDYGMDSVALVRMSNELNQYYGLEITPALLFEGKTVAETTQHLYEESSGIFNQFYKLTSSLDEDPHFSKPSESKSTQDSVKIEESKAIEKIQEKIISILSGILKIQAQEIKPARNMSDYGIDSVALVRMSNELNQYYSLEITPALLFEGKTIAESAQHLYEAYRTIFDQFYELTLETTAPAHPPTIPQSVILDEIEKTVTTIEKFNTDEKVFRENKKSIKKEDIAVIGMSGIFPKSSNLKELWKNLEEQKNLISEIPASRWNWKNYYGEGDNQTKVKWGGFIEGIDEFDAEFFSISPHEAELMDPQQRLFMQTVWSAVEDAGYNTEALSAVKTGMFVGVATNDYSELLHSVQENSAHVSTGTAHSILPNRVSYFLNLSGPSEAIDTACSSALVAINHAVKAIQMGDCDLAIAGGVNALLTPTLYFEFTQAGMLSNDGLCKTFDKSANGYVRGEGVGAILLKPLDKAIQDGDHIYGVIKGSAVNHGGHVTSLTVPNPNAQAELIGKVWGEANIDPSTITYIEAHGTGTSLGDPVEVNGLKKAFRHLQKEQGITNLAQEYCGLGSIKTNMGHLEAAAGIVSVIKVLLAMQNKKLPGVANFKELNPYIDIKDSPFYIVTQSQEWRHLKNDRNEKIPYRAGVSSFGFGGANAHIAIEEAPQKETIRADLKEAYIITLSAKTPDAIERKILDLSRWLNQNIKNLNLADLENISYTLNEGRNHFNIRCAWVVSSIESLQEKLENYKKDKQFTDGFYGDLRKQPEDIAIYKQVLETTLDQLRLGIQSAQKYKEKLEALANLFVRGYEFNNDFLYSKGKQRISLPTYPFAKEKYWIPENKNAKLITNKKMEQNNFKEYVILDKELVQSHIDKNVSDIKGTVVVLANKKNLSAIELLLKEMPSVQSHIISDLFEGENKENYHTLNYIDAIEGKKLGDLLDKKLKKLSGIWDFSDIGEDRFTEDWGKIALLQTLIKNKRKEHIQLIHFSKGLRSNSLKGAMIASLIKIIDAEYGWIHAKTIDLDLEITQETVPHIKSILKNEIADTNGISEIYYLNTNRYAPSLKVIFKEDSDSKDSSLSKLSILENGVYVITGGTRGIGMEIAHHFAKKGAKHLILMGNRTLPPRQQWGKIEKQKNSAELKRKIENIKALEESGITVDVYTGKLTDKTSLEEFFNSVRDRYGSIKGVVHCAGLLKNEHPAFINKTIEEMKEVCEPKIEGLNTLHDIFKKDKLDFFILFSSISGQIPKLGVGIIDYAMANSYMDYFAAYQRAKGHEYYQSIAWSNWKEAGMGEAKNVIYNQLGFISHTNHEGLYLLEKTLEYSGKPNLITGIVNKALFYPERLLITEVKKIPEVKAAEPENQEVKNKEPSKWLATLFSKQLRLPIEKLDPNVPFGDFGVDSILLAEIVKKMEIELSTKLDPSILLEYQTLNTLNEYLANNYLIPERKEEASREEREIPRLDISREAKATSKSQEEDIAIIGIACHFPGASNKKAFWQNLMSGKSSITEVPPLRWDINELYSTHLATGKSISKWGGFIDKIDYFDPVYFGIDKEDASQIDPLERQFLEVSVQVLRDAGYHKKELWHKNVGVFVGSRVSNYADRIEHVRRNSIVGVGQNFIAAHVSHFFNFTGPSLVVDTACSSSLVSVHMACQSLQTGECEIALAGGVDILLDEKPYLILSEAQALSPDGKCHTFDEAANGFVPGEGCGAVLLKPLSRALADGDHIYAVIEASAINNDGHTMGITTPNPKAQAGVIEEAFNKGDIDCSTISYIETHGTGTMIGDPIELRALTSVFSKKTDKKDFCAVGSVKTNIGHALSAAGIASIIKVALSIHYKKLVPSLNCKKPNPRFNFKDSPFYPNTKLGNWEPIDGLWRAGISSFGFGGTNAHCVLRGIDEDLKSQSHRRPLPLAKFNRQHYWLEKIGRTKEKSTFTDNKSLDHLEIFLQKRA